MLRSSLLCLLGATVAMGASEAHAQGPSGDPKPMAEYRGRILPADKDFRLSLLADGSATANWVGSAGKTNVLRGTYTGSNGDYDLSMTADPSSEQFHRSLKLLVRSVDGNVTGDWSTDRYRVVRKAARLELISGKQIAQSDHGASRAGQGRRPVVGMIRSNGAARRASGQSSALKRTVAKSYRSGSKRIARAMNRLNKRKRR